MRRILFVAALLTLTALAGCASDADPAPTADEAAPTAASLEQQAAQAVPEGRYDLEGPLSKVLVRGSLAIKPVEHVYIPSGIDGADIEMGVWLPETTEKVPVLVHASPYYGFLMGAADGDAGGETVVDKDFWTAASSTTSFRTATPSSACPCAAPATPADATTSWARTRCATSTRP